jgi:hypothetical protein
MFPVKYNIKNLKKYKMNKLSKKAKFAMIKSGVIKSNDNLEQSVWDVIFKDCETLNEAKSELSESMHKYKCLQSQIDNKNSTLWYLGTQYPASPKMVLYTSLWLKACNNIAKELGYKFDRHFLISLN